MQLLKMKVLVAHVYAVLRPHDSRPKDEVRTWHCGPLATARIPSSRQNVSSTNLYANR